MPAFYKPMIVPFATLNRNNKNTIFLLLFLWFYFFFSWQITRRTKYNPMNNKYFNFYPFLVQLLIPDLLDIYCCINASMLNTRIQRIRKKLMNSLVPLTMHYGSIIFDYSRFSNLVTQNGHKTRWAMYIKSKSFHPWWTDRCHFTTKAKENIVSTIFGVSCNIISTVFNIGSSK